MAPSGEQHDVIIVGAGPVGLALALDLGRRGVRSVVVERQPGTGTELVAKASIINERTMEYCRSLGIAEEVASSGYPDDLPGDTVFCTGMSGHLIGRLKMASALERELPEQCCEMLRRCPQLQFDPILARAVERQGMADIRYDTALVSIKQDDAAVTCTLLNLKDGSAAELQSRYVAACDGPGSLVRSALGFGFQGEDLGYAISAIVRIDLTSYNTFGRNAERYMFVNAGGVWGNFTAIDGKSLWRFSIAGGKDKTDLSTVDMDGLIRKALGSDNIEFEVIRVDQWRRSQYTASTFYKGRVFLAGDAAHTMSPTGGHGLNTGLADAMTLGWMLQAYLEGWGGHGLGYAYTRERLPVAVRNGTGSTRSIWTDTTGREKVLDSGDDADAQRKALGDRMADNMRQEFQALGLSLGYSYHDESPIVIPDGSTAPPDAPGVYVQSSRPGHRAPHYWLTRTKSTLDLFGGSFVLLALSAEAQKGAEHMAATAKGLGMPLQVVRLDNAAVSDLYEKSLVLVRPDGMVAWRGHGLPDNVEDVLNVVRGVL